MTAPNSQALSEAVRAALGDLETKPEDGAARQLALTYATAIDRAPSQLGRLGPGLLAVMESLGMTPRARAALLSRHGGGGQGADGGPPRSRMDEYRERRRRSRQYNTSVVDPAAS